MSALPRLLLGSSQLGWVTALTQWVSEHGGARVVGQALTQADVDDADFDVLVLDGWSSLLSRRLVIQTQREGAAVMVLVHPDHEPDERLVGLGVSLSLPLSATPEQIVSRASEVAAVRRMNGHIHAPTASPPDEMTPMSRHKLLVVLGTSGVTELAVNLAAIVARMVQPVAVADLDTVEPSVAQRLGLPLLPNLLTASDAIRSSEFGPESLIRHPDGFGVIAGLANPREWDSYSQVEADDLARELRNGYALTIAVVNRMLEDLAPLSGLEARFDVARRVVSRADEVVVCVPFSPIGLTQALDLIADIRALTQAPVRVVADRVPKGVFQKTEWERELERSFGPESMAFLPDDREVGRAGWDGRLPTRGGYVKAVRQFAADLAQVWAS